MANETGAGNFVDSYLGKDETYGTFPHRRYVMRLIK